MDDNVAVNEIRNGNIDAYFFRVPFELASSLSDDPSYRIYERTALSYGLYLNPAPARDGDTINPFTSRNIRYALNFLFDRNFIVNEIFKGYGISQIDPFGTGSPEYLNIVDDIEALGLKYDFSFAEKTISKELVQMGAKKVDGKWLFNQKPITIKIFIRSDEIPRKSLGELVASQIAKLGFTVVKDYGDLNKANTVVYGSDPQDFKWHIYIEAFASSAFSKYSPVTVAQMYSPWFGNMPGAQNPNYWQYTNESLDKLTQKLTFSNFTSEDERQELLRNSTKLGISESIRIFLIKSIDPIATSSSVGGLINDFGSGIVNRFSLINAKSQDNGLDIGVKQIYQGAWNDVGGYNDAYSRPIIAVISDPSMFVHPHTGETFPIRNIPINITTEGPIDRLLVDNGAQTWDSKVNVWTTIQQNTTTLSKGVYKLIYSNWHHGIPMDKFDIIYSQYFPLEWGDNNTADKTQDPEYTSRAQQSIKFFKGFKFLSHDTVETYFDMWHYDPVELSSYGSMWADSPWEISAAAERLVLSGKLAYSRSESIAKGIDWLSLIIPQHAQLIKSELETMMEENFIPEPLKEFVDYNYALKRYNAAIKWIEEHNHAIISNGPFYLDNYNPSARTITINAFQDSTYPFDNNKWKEFETPKLAKISNTIIPQVIKIGTLSTITIDITVANQPSHNATINYFLFDKDGRLVDKGDATPLSNTKGKFTFTLTGETTSNLKAGPNTIKLFAYSNYAYKPDILTKTVLSIP